MTRRLLLAAIAASALTGTTASAQTATLVHHFDFSADATSKVGGLTTATGTLAGNATISGGALQLSGAAWVDLIPVVPVAADYNSSTWTVSVWARSTLAPGARGVILSQGALQGFDPDFGMGVTASADGSGMAFALNRSGWSGGGYGRVADPGAWTLYTTVMSHFSGALFLNGVFQSANGNSLYPCCYQSQAARIGREVANFGSQFAGEIDDLRIYRGTLSTEQMLAQAAAGPSAVSAVPEPSQAALLAMGGLALWLHRRRSPTRA